MDYAKLFTVDKTALPLRMWQPRRTHCVTKPSARRAQSPQQQPASPVPAKPIIAYRLSDKHPFALKIKATGPSLYERASQSKALQQNNNNNNNNIEDSSKQQEADKTTEAEIQENVPRSGENGCE